jgi:uncharacterized SAM-dependent methyltransferase
MLADKKSSALVENFAGQWLQLRNLKGIVPNPETYPDFDDNLRQAFRTEAEMFFADVIHQDSNVLDLMTSDRTFVNERLAKHYGIPGVFGSDFRPDEFDHLALYDEAAGRIEMHLVHARRRRRRCCGGSGSSTT